MEEQVNDHLQRYLNEICHLKQHLACTEEKMAYLSYERAKEIWVRVWGRKGWGKGACMLPSQSKRRSSNCACPDGAVVTCTFALEPVVSTLHVCMSSTSHHAAKLLCELWTVLLIL